MTQRDSSETRFVFHQFDSGKFDDGHAIGPGLFQGIDVAELVVPVRKNKSQRVVPSMLNKFVVVIGSSVRNPPFRITRKMIGLRLEDADVGPIHVGRAKTTRSSSRPRKHAA
jgi:hypothetical protein